MKILGKDQAYEADKKTIERQNITSWELMERAGKSASAKIIELFPKADRPFSIFCGIGNNGGDGLVIARYLAAQNFPVRVFVVALSDKRSEDFEKNHTALREAAPEVQLEELKDAEKLPKFAENEVVVDAIFGIGLNRPAEGWLKETLQFLNENASTKIAVDIPSGLYLDDLPNPEDTVFKADYTLTVQFPKLVFFFPATGKFVGELYILDIGMDPEYLDQVHPEAHYLRREELKLLYRKRKRFSHKGTYGHALVAGGSRGKMGSVTLAATAALRSGAGKVTVLVPHCGNEIIQTALPEAMTLNAGKNNLEQTELNFDFESIGFGVGAGTSRITANFFENLLKDSDTPLVIDADGLNIIAKDKPLLQKLPKKSILTPHPGELKRLIGNWEDDFAKIEKAKAFAEKHAIILVLKDAFTFITDGDQLYVNSTGNAGMATAGSGDTLTGIITGLLAQNYIPFKAAQLGVYLHGLAGDFASEKVGEEALVAGDLIEYLRKAFLYLKNL